ncbi:CAF17-like 4Fe-4S cluster assembly/insertion protein YgfZ [Marisediminicola antarctica]|uniref:Aminomethyltransferase n=1 Tax=Marisediminicola antarctica TaxID=674079 RepID=A0A7L5AHE1_9MICO|nr:folate-binding protein YgfZ [Marisediminicola antarctica]QHO69175.1 aminomethyltransferase [Marisediminicola antarctica]
MTSEFLGLPGAVAATGADAGVAAHYGDPFREQRALARGEAVVDLSHRAVISVSGSDRLSWIDSITSQAVKGMRPGDSSETLLLDQHGHLEYAVGLLDDGETLWMLLEASEAPGLLDWLTRMRFMLRVEPADRSAEFAVIGAVGDAGLPAAAPAGVPLIWRDPWSAVAPGGHQYAAADGHPAADWHWTQTIVPRSALAEIAATRPAAGILAAEALRIAAWRPRAATEVDERSIPHELDWLRSAVHLTKGCYRGQETVAKVHNLGHPPRRLVMLHLDGSDAVLPHPGDEVMLKDKCVGKITSSAIHFELGPIALAVVKRSADPASTLTVATDDTTVAAAQEIIVPPDAGATAGVPRIPRLGAVRR